MQLSNYEEPQLAGFSLKKTLKKVGTISRKIAFPVIPKQLKPLAAKLDATHMKVIDKVAVPVVHAAAAYFTGGATLAISAQMMMKEKQKKAQEALARGETEEYNRQMAEIQELQRQELAKRDAATATARPAAPNTTITAVAPTQAAVQQQVSQAQLQPISYTVPTDSPMRYDEGREQPMQALPKAALPSWAIPAGVGALALIAAVTLIPRRGR